MKLIYAIAEYFDLPNEFIIIDRVIADIVWFHTTAGASYTCRTVGKEELLKKNSIRLAQY